jgi:hypothetical protein
MRPMRTEPKLHSVLIVFNYGQRVVRVGLNTEEIPSVPLKKIIFFSVSLKKLFFLIYPRLSFFFLVCHSPSRKHTLKVIFIKDVSRNNFKKIITHKRDFFEIFSKFYEVI